MFAHQIQTHRVMQYSFKKRWTLRELTKDTKDSCSPNPSSSNFSSINTPNHNNPNFNNP